MLRAGRRVRYRYDALMTSGLAVFTVLFNTQLSKKTALIEH